MAVGKMRSWARGAAIACFALTLSAGVFAEAQGPGGGGPGGGPPGGPPGGVPPGLRPPKDLNAGPCPLMGVLYDASRMVEFKGPEERLSNVGFTGEMRGVSGLCRYVGADPITMNLTVNMAFGRGPAAGADRHTYRYWVAVARRDVAPIFKQYYEVEVDFAGSDRTELSQEIKKITIPRANPETSGVNFEILVGFDVTPEQLAFNRDGKRFRSGAGG